MTIKQQGGIFGRNPTFNDLTVEGSVNLPSGSVSGDSIDGGSTVTNASAEALKFNRTGTNGDIVEFLKDGSSVGTIGSEGGDALYIQSGTTSGTGLLFSSNNTAIRAARNGVTVDATLDLGSSTRRFRNLHLSGDVIVASGQGIDFSATSGTGTSELFNDYEEGTFTPDIIGSVSAGTGTYAYRIGRYTKIGDRVLFNLIMSWSAHTGTGFMRIDGLPFTSMASSPYYHAVNIGYIENITTTALTVPSGFIPNNSTQIWMGQIPTGGGAWTYMGIDTAGDINISGQYEV